MLGHPYLASAVARLPIRETEDEGGCETMATDGYHIFVNRAYCDTLTDEETSFILAHELLHCLLGHIDRRGDRNRDMWNAAVDFATNGLLVELGWTMPREGLFDASYRGMTAEAVYDRLMAGTSQSGPRSGPAVRRRSGQSRGQRRGAGARLVDAHIEPSDALARAQSDLPSADERRRLRQTLTTAMANALTGKAAAYFQVEIEAAKSAAIPWEHLLARFVTGLRKSDYRWYPINRKHLWRGYYLPALGVPGPEHLVAFVDTSGSMTNDILTRVAAELDQLRAVSECRLTVVQSDTTVQDTQVFEPYEDSSLGRATKRTTFYGRGGTDLRVPFEWLAQQVREGKTEPLPDAIIFLTDGYGPMPPAPPEWPVLWLVTKLGVPTVPFGTLVRMEA
jgi:predicted metal-dependent peptidase